MATLSIGPGLANFPAFPDPTTVDPTSLGFEITPDRFSFSINGYQFEFTGDFSAIPEPRVPNFFATLSPEFPPSQIPFITISGNRVTQIATGQTAIGFSGAEATLPVNFFFATLLDPRNFTDDIITAFFQDISQFTTLDLSAFNNGAFIGAPNAAVISPEGSIGVVSFESELDGFSFQTIIGGSGADRLFGNEQDNLIQGNQGNDILFGVAGDDTLEGDRNQDILIGGTGNDTLKGGNGKDTLVGESGNDHLFGGAGKDTLNGGTGKNTLTGGAGADKFVLSEGNSLITDFSRQEGDKIDISSLGIRKPQQIAKRLKTGLSLNSAGQLVLRLTPEGIAGNQSRTLTFQNLSRKKDLRISDFTTNPGVAFNNPITDGLSYVGSSKQNESIFGTQKSDQLMGFGGDDQIFGQSGADLLSGGKGDDLLVGGAGKDLLLGNRGSDVLYGGAGTDLLKGNRGKDLLYGGSGNDDLLGGRGDDILDGGAGRDRLNGGAGSNTLTGGTGADTFRFEWPQGQTKGRTRGQARGQKGVQLDRITDFEVGLDKIDISALVIGNVTAANLSDYINITSPGPTELTRFVGIDANGTANGSQFTPLFQIDDVTDAQLLTISNYIF